VQAYEFEEEEFSTQFNGRLVARVFGFAKPHWPWLVGFLATIAAVSALDSYFTYLSKRIIDEGILPQNREVLFELVAIYGGLVVVQAANVFGFIYLAGILGERIMYDLRKKAFTHLQSLSLSYFDRTPIGWIMSRVMSDAERIAELVTWGLLDVTWALANIGTAVIFMLIINWRLALIVIGILPMIVVVAAQFKKKILIEFRMVRKLNSKLTATYNENISGVRVVKALRREEENLREFGVLTDDMYRSSYRAAWLSALFLPTVQILSSFAIGAIALYGGIQNQIGGLTIGGIQAFVSYITFMLWPIQDLARVYAQMQQSIASAERLFSLIDAVPEIDDQPDAFDPGTIKGEVAFEDVGFY
jgi:ATP-binding cassette subfamily B protein